MDDSLISVGDMILLDAEMSRNGNVEAARRLSELEPALFDYIDKSIKQMAGELILRGTPTEVVGQTANRMMSLVLSVLEATHRATYRTWAESLEGTPLAHLRSLLQDRADGGSHPH